MTTTPQDWFKQWEALSQRYWDGWKNQGVGAPGFDASAPWQAGLEQWAKLLAPAVPAQSDLVERVTANAKAYVALMQSMIGAAAGQQGAAGANPAAAWTEALKNGFNVPGIDPALFNNPLAGNLRDIAGQGAKGFEQMMAEFAKNAAAPLRGEALAALNTPAFGLAREHQERWQKLGAAWIDYQEQNGRYNALILKASQSGFERFQGKLAEREEPGRQLDSVKAVYDLWVDAAEEAYADIALSDEFRKVYGAMVNAQMRVRALMQAEVEQQTRQLGMPTRSELSSVEKSLHEVRRTIRANREAHDAGLAAEVAALRAELTALKREIGKPAAKAENAKPETGNAKPSKNKR
ncbi:MAG TPA: class III poly(R)-hydroxyalkanoic acid synthase subunit PhaE [Tahibacter sp.]|nr:class III poly(R)-hydroxyalkanoic acid synthase subunit PhaE [Tahibacter sp.]